VTINSDGSFSGQLIDNLGDPDSASGTFTISPEGIVTWAGQDNLRCAMDSGKTIIACTNIWSYDYPNTTEMMIMTKMSGSYSLEDLSGTWESSGLATGPSAPWWERAHLEIGADGSFSATTLENDGSGHEILGNLQISSSGIITITGGPSFRGNMDANKTIMVWTDTWDSEGTTEMKVLTKVSN
jgi:hypothetical protein